LICCLLVAVTNVEAQEDQDSEPLLPVRVKGKWGYINGQGKLVIRPTFTVAAEFSEGLARVRDDCICWYFINRNGKEITKERFRFADEFSEGLAMVQGENHDDKIGFINKSGEYVIPPRFDSFNGRIVWGFRDGLAIVALNGKFGYINKNGNFVIEPQFDSADPFSEGFAVVSKIWQVWLH